MNDEKYYSKAMKLFDEDKEKAIDLLKKGASKSELKSIEKLIDINVKDYQNKTRDEGENETSFTWALENIVKYAEMECKIDKKYNYELGCLYMCIFTNHTIATNVYYCDGKNDNLIRIISDGDIPSLNRFKNYMNFSDREEYLHKAFSLFESNLSDVRNKAMYLGLLYCFKTFNSKFENKYEEMIEIIEKDKDYLSKTDYLRLPLKTYYHNNDYDKAKLVANMIIQKEKDNIESDDYMAAYYILLAIRIKEENLDLLDLGLDKIDETFKYITKAGKFIYDELAKNKNDLGLLFTILSLYEDKKELDIDFPLDGDYDSIKENELCKKLEDDENQIIDTINKYKKYNAFKYCLWKYYSLKYILTNNKEYFKKYIIAKADARLSVQYDLKALLSSSNDEDIEMAISYSKNNELWFDEIERRTYTLEDGDKYTDDFSEIRHFRYEDIKNNVDFFKNHFLNNFYLEENTLKAIYECKNNHQNNAIIEKLLYNGLLELGDETEETIHLKSDEDTISSENAETKLKELHNNYEKNVIEKFDFDEINVIEHKFYKKMISDYEKDRNFEYDSISEIDNLSLLTKLLIKKYQKSDNDQLIEIIEKAEDDKIIDSLIDEDNFDLDKIVEDRKDLYKNDSIKYYYLADNNLKLKTVANYKIKDIIFDCLLNIYKENDELSKLKDKLSSDKNRIFVNKYINLVQEEIDYIKTGFKELKKGQDDIKNNLDAIFTKLLGEIKILKTDKNDDEKLEEVSEKMYEKISNRLNDLIQLSTIDKYELRKKEIKELFGDEYSKIDQESKDMLISSYLTYDYLHDLSTSFLDVDYSGVCLLASMVVEREIKKRLYKGYVDYRYEKSNHNSSSREFVLGNKTIKSENHFTLGSVNHLVNGETQPDITDDVVRYIKEKHIMIYNSDNKIRESLIKIGLGCDHIATEFRNKSAHTGNVKMEIAYESLKYIVETTKFLINTLKDFKN